jgi:hypothetical protein
MIMDFLSIDENILQVVWKHFLCLILYINVESCCSLLVCRSENPALIRISFDRVSYPSRVIIDETLYFGDAEVYLIKPFLGNPKLVSNNQSVI